MLEIRGEREDLSERFQKLMLLIKSERYKYKIDSDNIVRAGNEALDREKVNLTSFLHNFLENT